MSKNDYTSYLVHYKTKGAKKGVRRYQSYEVAPNPSGYVGQEVGEAAKQRARMSPEEISAEKHRETLKKESDSYYTSQSNYYQKKHDAYAKKSEALAAKGKKDKAAAIAKKATNAESLVNSLKTSHEYSTGAIMNMSMDELLKDKKQRKADLATSFMLYATNTYYMVDGVVMDYSVAQKQKRMSDRAYLYGKTHASSN